MAEDLRTKQFAPLGVVIAGGQSTRMGHVNKLHAKLGSLSLIEHAVRRLECQLAEVVINAAPHALNQAVGRPVVPDVLPNFQGPLAGLAAIEAYLNDNDGGFATNPTHIVTIPADTPFFPVNLVERYRLAAKSEPDSILIADYEGYAQPIFGCWPRDSLKNLGAFLATQANRKIMLYVRQHNWQKVGFEAAVPPPFFNINTPADLADAEAMLTNIKEGKRRAG